MSTTDNSYFFRHRTIGRAASPPTWACYEQIPYDGDDSDSGSDSCSEDEDDYPRIAAGQEPMSDPDEVDHAVSGDNQVDDIHVIDMDMDEEGIDAADNKADSQRNVKGKQRAIDPEPESKKHRRRKERPPVYTLRPILTIQKSQGFVWNQVGVHFISFHETPLISKLLQDLFVPPYIKDRCSFSSSHTDKKYAHFADLLAIFAPLFLCLCLSAQIIDVASTSPPNSKGFISTSTSSANSALPDYEVEVVEIRVNEGDLDYLRP